MIIDWSIRFFGVQQPFRIGLDPVIVWPTFGSPPSPTPTGDDQNRVRVGMVRSAYLTDNPSVGGQF